jgi:glucuronate isomerase
MGFLDEKYLLRTETALAIYNKISKLPVVDPHNHANVAEIAANKAYPNPWQLFAATDHYVWSALRNRGVAEEFITGKADPKTKWMKMAAVFPDIAGNPVYEWVHLDLKRYLEIDLLIGPSTGEEIWERAKAVLGVKSKHPQNLLKEIGVETMCSTDDPVDLLKEHDEINKAFKRKFIRPTWRPDKAMNIFSPQWPDYVQKLEERFNTKIKSVADMVDALKKSHDYFADHGAVISDHALEYPLPGAPDEAAANAALKKALDRKPLSRAECEAYMSHILGEMAEMNAQKDWVTQLHMGAVRNIRDSIFENIGPDAGGDVSTMHFEIVAPLKKFLNRFDGRLKTVLYCLDPWQQPTFATVARVFGSKVRIGSAWWYNDTPIGMRRQLEYIGSIDLLSKFAGMVSDSRKLLSYGSRFEVFRRTLADVLGEMAEMGQMPYANAESLAVKMAYTEPKQFFGL